MTGAADQARLELTGYQCGLMGIDILTETRKIDDMADRRCEENAARREI